MFRVEWLRDLLAMPVPEAGKKGTKTPPGYLASPPFILGRLLTECFTITT